MLNTRAATATVAGTPARTTWSPQLAAVRHAKLKVGPSDPRCVVTIDEVLAPNFVVPGLKTIAGTAVTLGDFGAVPFDVALPYTMVAPHVAASRVYGSGTPSRPPSGRGANEPLPTPTVNMRVLGRFGTSWDPGTITSVCEGGTFNVTYDDGLLEAGVAWGVDLQPLLPTAPATAGSSTAPSPADSAWRRPASSNGAGAAAARAACGEDTPPHVDADDGGGSDVDPDEEIELLPDEDLRESELEMVRAAAAAVGSATPEGDASSEAGGDADDAGGDAEGVDLDPIPDSIAVCYSAVNGDAFHYMDRTKVMSTTAPDPNPNPNPNTRRC